MPSPEKPGRTPTRRGVIVLVTGCVILLAATLALRAGAVSEALGRVILPELDKLTGMTFSLQRVTVNLLPLFVEVRDMEGFDAEGRRVLSAPRLKGYVGLSGLLRRELIISRIVAPGLEVSTTRQHLEEVIRNVRAYLAEDTKAPLKVVIKSLEPRNASIMLSDGEHSASLRKLSGLAVLGEEPRFIISSGTLALAGPGTPDLAVELKAETLLRRQAIEIRSLTVAHRGSRVEASGSLKTDDFAGELLADLRLMVESVKSALGLRTSGEGQIEARGNVRVSGPVRGPQDIVLDMKVTASFYLESLMEVLKVEEDLRGWLNLDGSVEGALTDLKGLASATLSSGRLYGVVIDKVQCRVDYSDRTMRFLEGLGSLYGGTARAEAAIALPVVDHFTLKVTAAGLNSSGIFRLIGWDPGIPEGKVDADLQSSGSIFSPHAVFHYRSTERGKDVLGRVAEVKGSFDLKDGVIGFQRLEIATGASDLSAEGRVDLGAGTLFFKGNGGTKDTRDLSGPYFEALSGEASLALSLSGPIADPVIEASFSSGRATLSRDLLGYPKLLSTGDLDLTGIRGSISYRKDLLRVDSLEAETGKGSLRFSGSVAFQGARHLFDLSRPDYSLRGTLITSDLGTVGRSFRNAPKLAGRAAAELSLRGKPESLLLSGRVRSTALELDGKVHLDSAEGTFSLTAEGLLLDEVKAAKGTSEVLLKGMFHGDGRFGLTARAGRLNPGDFLALGPEGAASRGIAAAVVLEQVSLRGEGTLDDPRILATAKLNGKNRKEEPLGKGDLRASLEGRRLDIAADILDGKVALRGEALLNETLPWTVSARLQPGRYDPLISLIFRNVPEDLIVSVKGTVSAEGDRKNLSARASLDSAHLNLYGIGFTSKGPINLRFSDGRVLIDSLSLRSETAEFTAGGSFTPGKAYDLAFEGTSSLSIFKFLSKNIEVLRGDAAFSISLTGDWGKPQLSGAIDVTDGSLGLKNLPYRVTSVQAYLYFDGDRLVLEKAAGKVSGGTVSATGSAIVRGTELSRFSFEARMQDITATVSKDVVVSFDGNLLYKGTAEAQTVLGDINVRKARYTEKIDLQSMALKARERERPRADSTKLDETRLNVRVLAPHVTVSNNLARASLNVDLLVKGTVGQPVPFGKVEAQEGIIYFMGNEYTLSKARIDFTNPNRINPYFDITADTRVTGYTIRLSLSGFMDRFNLSLTSTPYLSESDIFSLLTVGHIGPRPAGGEGGSTLSGAGSVLAGQLSSVYDERLRTVSGLDRIVVEPYTTRTGEFTTRLTVAKKVGDKLYVSYGTALSTGAEQVWKIEYLLTRNISLVGTRDELGSIGGDVKFRFEFR